jgi:hypothetical protein
MGPVTKEEDSFPLDDLGSAERDDPRQELERLGVQHDSLSMYWSPTGLGLRPHTLKGT